MRYFFQKIKGFFLLSMRLFGFIFDCNHATFLFHLIFVSKFVQWHSILAKDLRQLLNFSFYY